jgi:hypothetical protein
MTVTGPEGDSRDGGPRLPAEEHEDSDVVNDLNGRGGVQTDAFVGVAAETREAFAYAEWAGDLSRDVDTWRLGGVDDGGPQSG